MAGSRVFLARTPTTLNVELQVGMGKAAATIQKDVNMPASDPDICRFHLLCAGGGRKEEGLGIYCFVHRGEILLIKRGQSVDLPFRECDAVGNQLTKYLQLTQNMKYLIPLRLGVNLQIPHCTSA